MMDNYNSLSWRQETKLKSCDPDVVGYSPHSIGKARTSWFFNLVLTLLVLTGTSIYAQLANYAFTSSSGTYTPVSGGTQLIASGVDSGVSAVTSIGFNFVFDGTTYTQFSATSNGWIKLGGTVGSAYTTTPLSTTAQMPSIALFARDAMTGSAVVYQLSGTSPNQVLTIDFPNYYPYYGTTTPALNMQAKLYEGTNKIEIIYGAYTSGTSYTGQVGLASSSTSYANRTSTTSWSSSAAGTANTDTMTLSSTVFPASGLTYTWTPPVPCSGTPVSGTVTPSAQYICSGGTVSNLVASGFATGLTGITFQWQQSTDGGSNWVSAVGGSGATTTTYTPPVFGGSAILYRLRTTCANGGATSDTAPVSVNPPVNPVTQVSNATTSGVGYNGMTLSWTNGSGNRRVVILNTGSITDPTNGNAAALTANAVYAGSGQQIMYDGTGTSVTITGLTAGTTYSYKVYEYNRCGSGPYDYYYNVTSGTNTGSVSTCNGISSFPWTENFDGMTSIGSNVLPSCWAQQTGSSTWTSANAASNTYNDPRSTPNYMTIYYGSTPDYLWTPGFQLSAGVSYDFSFYFVGDATAGWNADVLQNTLQSATGATALGASFVVGTTTTSGGTTYTKVTRTFVPSSSGIYFFGIKAYTSTTAPWYLGFDDFSLALTPSCVVPTALTSSAVTNNSATIGWTASTTPPANGYDYYYSTSSTAPISSTTPSGNVGTTTYSASLSGLSSSTLYYFWVRSNCSGSEQSSWAGSGTFTTSCDPVITFPWTETFETTSTTLSCFRVIDGNADGDAWSISTTFPYAGTSHASLYTDYNSSNNDYLITPQLILGAQPKRLTFWVRARSASEPDEIAIKVSTTGTAISDFTSFALTSTPVASTTYTKVSVDLTAYVNQNVYLAFVRNAAPADGWYIYVDDVTVENIPSCYEPTAVTTASVTNNSASLSWTAPTQGTPSTYEYEVRSSGAAGSGATGLAASGSVTVPTVSASVTGLSSNTTYSVYVRTYCGGSDYSAWTTAVTFKTLCDPIASLPWTEGFESTTVGSTVVGTSTNLPDCWNSQSTQWSSSNATTYNNAHGGSKYIRYAWSTTNAYMWTPGFQLTAGQSYDFSFWAQGDGGVEWNNDVFVNTSVSSTGATQLGATYTPPGTGTYTIQTYAKITRTFVPSTSGVYYFAIRGNEASGDPLYMAFDDFTLEVTPVTVTSFNPTEACSSDLASTTVTLTGSNFTGASDVQLNGVSHAFSVVNDTTITVTLTGSSASGAFTVYKGALYGTSATNFTVKANPTVAPITGPSAVCTGSTITLASATSGNTWNSLQPTVATVDSNGEVTGISAGTATIEFSVTDLGCTTTVTKTVDVYEIPVVTGHPASATVVTGDDASFTVVATGSGLTYQWQYSDDLATFYDIVDDATYSGAATATLTINNTPDTFNGYQYRCIVSGDASCTTPAESNPADLAVGDTGIATQPVNANLCGSGNASFTVVATGTVDSYTWYVNDGATVTAVVDGGMYSGADTATLTITGATTLQNGYAYYVQIAGPANTATSTEVYLNVSTLPTVTDPSNASNCFSGGSSNFSVTPSNSSAIAWEYSTSAAGPWSGVVDNTPIGATYTGASSNTLSVSTTSATPVASYYYRANVSGIAPCASVQSAAGVLTINTFTIGTQPVAATIVRGNTATYTVATAAPSPVYQWQRSATAGGSYVNVTDATPTGVTYTGANSATLNVITSAAAATGTANYYRCIVSSPAGCSVVSGNASLTMSDYCASNATDTVDDDIAQVTFGALVNPAVLPSPLTSNSAAVNTYTNFTSLPAVSFTQGVSYPISVAQFNSGTYYACWTKVFIDWNQDGDFNDTGETFNGTGGADGPSTAPTNGIVYSSNITIPITALTGNTRMRIVLDESGSATSTANGCGTYSWGETEDYTINILPAPACSGTPVAGAATTSNSSTCLGGTANLSLTGASSGFTGLSYQWFGRTLPSGSFAAISGANSNTFTTAALTQSSEFYCEVTCTNSGLTAQSNTVSVTVNNCEYTVTRNVVPYSSIMATGSTYTSLSGSDDGKTNVVSLAGTTFKYNGAVVTGFYAVTNGWMTFNTSQTSQSYINDLTSSSQNNVLAPFWDDLVIKGNASANKDTSMRYKINGTLGSGSAEIIIEWAEMEKYNYGDPNLNFQVVLKEVDNSINFNYGTMQLFNGSTNNTSNGYWTYSIGMNGTSPTTASTANRLILQNANSYNFGTTNQTGLKDSPTCGTQLRFVPAAAYSGGSAPASIPANNEVAGAITIPVNNDPCVDVCGNVYTSKNATASSGITACSAATPGTADDDVFFSFTTNATITNYRIEALGSTNYNAVIQVLDSTLTPIACSNATGAGLAETIASLALSTSTQYYIRVYDSATGVAGGASGSGEFAICVSQVLPPPAYDEPAGATALTLGTSCAPVNSISNEVLRATATAGVQTCNAGTPGTPDDDVWYTFTTGAAPAGISHTITVQGGSTYNPVVQVFAGTPSASNSLTCVNATGNGGVENFSSTTLLPNTTYYVRVYHSGAGAANGNFSICAFVSIPNCVASPSAPANASAQCESASVTTLSWPAVANATAYDVYLDLGSSATTLVSADQTGLSFTTPAALTPGAYAWRVVPKNAYGTATCSTSFTFNVDAVITYYLDTDGDNYGNALVSTTSCTGAPAGYVADNTDCNDSVAAINPGLTEVLYDGFDNNCNGLLDEGYQLTAAMTNCGTTLTAINSTISCVPTSGIDGYRFEITNTVTNAVQTIDRPLQFFFLTQLANYDYATTYSIRVMLRKNGVWLGYYGLACLYSTPAVTQGSGSGSLQLQTYCGETLPTISTLVSTTPLSGSTGFKFRVTNTLTGSVQTLTRSFHWFSLTMLPTYSYGTTYMVEAAVKTTGDYSDYGSPCSVTTPEVPSLTNYCGGATVPTKTASVFTVPLNKATSYRYEITRYTDNTYTEVIDATQLDRAFHWFTFNMVANYAPNAYYGVRVQVMTAGEWSPWGDVCEIVSPATARTTEVASNDIFTVKGYPNPYDYEFNLQMESNSAAKVSIKVYDMVGKLIENQEVQPMDVPTVSIGSRYPSGVYNVVVSQGTHTQTLRMVRR